MKTELELKFDALKLKTDSYNSNILLDVINGKVVCPLVPRDKFYEDFTGVIVNYLTVLGIDYVLGSDDTKYCEVGNTISLSEKGKMQTIKYRRNKLIDQVLT